MSKLKIEYIDINKLIPYINNPRINDNAVDKVAASIKEFGFKNPIIVDKENVIIAGHTRLLASRKLDLKEVPILRVDDLTENQIKAFRIADNKTSEFAEWDMELLEIELEGLDDIFTGFDEEEFDDIMGIEPEIIEDDFDIEPPVNPISKRGDIWLLGKHRLMCGDSTGVDVDILVEGKSVDMLFTDPPYGYEYQSNGRVKSDKFDVLLNDDVKLDFMPKVKEFVKGFIFICASWKNIEEWVVMFREHFELTNMVVWDKGGGGMGDLKRTFATDHEFILTSHNNTELTGKRIGSVWSVGKDSAMGYVHATQKPIGLPAMAIEHTTNKNDTVLDLFGGSGSTLIACEQLNRICYMMELDEQYIDVIVNRYISFKESDEDVFLIRDGVQIPYKEVEKNE